MSVLSKSCYGYSVSVLFSGLIGLHRVSSKYMVVSLISSAFKSLCQSFKVQLFCFFDCISHQSRFAPIGSAASQLCQDYVYYRVCFKPLAPRLLLLLSWSCQCLPYEVNGVHTWALSFTGRCSFDSKTLANELLGDFWWCFKDKYGPVKVCTNTKRNVFLLGLFTMLVAQQ